MKPYCASRFRTIRRRTREVMVGDVGIGGDNPIRVQSMTTAPTQDVAATVKETIALAEVGCEIVRITAQNVKAAEALGDIRKELRAARIDVPLVADIHFLPSAAMEAVKHVDKIRINPGNYADKKKFAVLEYSDSEYQEELERLHEAFTPIVLECKNRGRAMRIGTNHGSLSDRIMNRFGDTPMGMVESAFEFARIAASHDYREIIFSFKASNPKVMIEAYRLAAARMLEEGFDYPLHLGVTEAGEGEDGRIKSAIGIGTLLYDGLGDTIRVSLTEDPVYEIPVAQDLVKKAEALHHRNYAESDPDYREQVDVYEFHKREVADLQLSPDAAIGFVEPARVIFCPGATESDASGAEQLARLAKRFPDNPVEGVLLRSADADTGGHSAPFAPANNRRPGDWNGSSTLPLLKSPCDDLAAWIAWAQETERPFVIDAQPAELKAALEAEPELAKTTFIATCSTSMEGSHALGTYRALAAVLMQAECRAPLWIRATEDLCVDPNDSHFTGKLIEASILIGGLICDGVGDLISVELPMMPEQSLTLSYNILQGSRNRSSKTEFVACPSCGRTLFDLQSTTQRIKARTGHLKGVTIAVMGCIVNGPGEMADADFGYVGGAPGKVNLYVGKTAVEFNIPTDRAVDALVELIKKHDKWVEPEPETVEA